MSLPLLDPAKFGLKGGCSTKGSDCCLLGTVIYDVLSERSPFTSYGTGTAILKVLDCERPARPRGARLTNALLEASTSGPPERGSCD